METEPSHRLARLWAAKSPVIVALSLGAIIAYLILRFGLHRGPETLRLPLLLALISGGGPLVVDLTIKLFKKQFGSDLLAGLSIITSIFLDEYLAGTIVVLMLSGGELLETYAVKNASSALRALAKRLPSIAHRKRNTRLEDISVETIQIGDALVIFPHEICPVDGIVTEGHGRMDESFLTGEPFEISKAPGSTVISGAVNGESAVTVQATKLPVDSRYAKIMEVMRASEEHRPHLRRLGDQLGAIYTPIAVAFALVAWWLSGNPDRFLGVLVVATPCPLLIAIPVAIIGSISLAARRGVIVKNPVVLEQIDRCRTIIFDKTGTLTYGEPVLIDQIIAPPFSKDEVLALAASLELYSKHPLSRAILAAAKESNLALAEVGEISEPPGCGLRGQASGHKIEITSRKKIPTQNIRGLEHLPPAGPGLECVILIDDVYAATYRFHDKPRADGLPFIQHLGPKHHFNRIMIVSGDREAEVKYLAEAVGISEIYAQKSPEEKVAIVRRETALAKTLYIGDGINDAPALAVATVGLAVGQNSDITASAAGAVVMDGTMKRIDEFIHISRRWRAIALQSAIGGMALSLGGMAFAAFGFLTPVEGALLQEVIDVLAIANALRAAWPPKNISDF